MQKFKTITNWDNQPVVVDIDTACSILRCCDVTVCKMLKNGKIKGAKDGKQWFISRDSIRQFVEGTTVENITDDKIKCVLYTEVFNLIDVLREKLKI